MPNQSERQLLLRELMDVMAVAALEEEDDEDMAMTSSAHDADDEEEPLVAQVDGVSEILLLVMSSRYFTGRERISKSTQFIVESFLESTPTSRFRQITRMVEPHNPIFQNQSVCPQAPVWLQLAIILDRFANYGTGASLSRSQRLWGIGKGTVDDYPGGVVKALNELSPQFVKWPSAMERRKTSRRMTKSGFHGCVGLLTAQLFHSSKKTCQGWGMLFR
ncbi:hypothetical protein PHMEG_00038979 [Phytophthora megakarya]|uniref:Uncharacterized protein n=1 Tax=Phytophthora megakarya TaxID=4795 RepID=A0A225UHQ8_9STRA|nr:hypothetical protein PHMEG_00038979 [Phytophthora megakarya]